MNKKIKTTDTDVRVATSTIDVVEIGGLSFEHDERYPWVDVYHIGNENKEFVEQIDGADMPTIVDIEDLKILSSNWYSNNVEVVKNIETAQEVPVQEQLSSIGKKIKLIQVSQTIYFILTMAVINLMFYRFNKIFQGFADIFYGNINIFETIIDIFKSI